MNTVKISSKGQIAIPKKIREALKIQNGDKFILEIKNKKILLEPVINIHPSQAWFWQNEIQQKIKKSKKDFHTGNYRKYESIDKLIDYLTDE